MPGAEVQLISPGEELAYLLGDADKTFWRSSVRRHTNFAVESVRQEFATTPALGGQASVLVSRAGDLCAGLFLELTVTKLDNRLYDAAGNLLYCRGNYHPAEALVRDATLTLNGVVLDRITCDWMRVFDALHRAPEAAEHYRRLTNFDAATLTSPVPTTETLYLPLIFSFCRHPGLALPLVAMWLTEVRVSFTFEDALGLGVGADGFSAALYADYVYLDAFEKSRMLNAARHDYLFEQVQTNAFTLPPGTPSAAAASAYAANLRFFRPVKCLYWVLRDSTPATPERSNYARYVGDFARTPLGYQPTQAAPSGLGLVACVSERLAPLASAKLVLNGVDRFGERRGTYFNKVHPYQYCRRCPLPGMYMYSFALSPEALQPSGVCNFSALSDAQLQLTFKRSVGAAQSDGVFAGGNAESLAVGTDTMQDLRVFAWGYNVLTIAGGQCGLLFGGS